MNKCEERMAYFKGKQMFRLTFKPFLPVGEDWTDVGEGQRGQIADF